MQKMYLIKNNKLNETKLIIEKQQLKSLKTMTNSNHTDKVFF